ncbi:MAG: SDR family oxidoreductase [Lachnospiraceae bacterium]|nr:SDR family oxidoreductase [Lachnospiraceae bacterium]
MKKRGYVLITGASSGIGRQFAIEYSKRDYIPILVARREERLKKLKRKLWGKSHIIVADITREEDVDRIFNIIEDIPIEIFINNAGFGLAGDYEDTALDREKSMIDLNITAFHVMFKRMLLKMEAQGRGTILNVASSAGLFPGGPYMATYYATKSYVSSLTSGVSEELRQKHSNVYVAALCPGPVDTEFNKVAGVTFALDGMTAFKCVRWALLEMKLRRTIIIPGFAMKLAAFGIRLIPRRLMLFIVSGQQKKKLG